MTDYAMCECVGALTARTGMTDCVSTQQLHYKHQQLISVNYLQPFAAEYMLRQPFEPCVFNYKPESWL